MSESSNDKNAGRKRKFTVATKSKTFRFPVVCEAEIVKAIARITKKYTNENNNRKGSRKMESKS